MEHAHQAGVLASMERVGAQEDRAPPTRHQDAAPLAGGAGTCCLSLVAYCPLSILCLRCVCVRARPRLHQRLLTPSPPSLEFVCARACVCVCVCVCVRAKSYALQPKPYILKPTPLNRGTDAEGGTSVRARALACGLCCLGGSGPLAATACGKKEILLHAAGLWTAACMLCWCCPLLVCRVCVAVCMCAC